MFERVLSEPPSPRPVPGPTPPFPRLVSRRTARRHLATAGIVLLGGEASAFGTGGPYFNDVWRYDAPACEAAAAPRLRGDI